MNISMMKKLFLLTLSMLFINSNLLATDAESLEKKTRYHLVCTSGARDCKLKEMLSDPTYTVAGLDLAYASGLENPLSLFRDPLPGLSYLKLKFKVDEIVSVLPEITPNLEILDISQTNLCNLTLLTNLSRLSSLRVLDISNIHSNTKLASIITSLLSENTSLTIYIKSLRRMSPHQERPILTIYQDNPRVVLDTYNSSLERMPRVEDSSVKPFIY